MFSTPKTQGPIRQIRLRPAYVWDCQECGREVFERGIVPEMAPEDMEKLREEYGVESWEDGDFVTMPDEVTCPYCHTSYMTLHFSDNEAEA